MTPSRGGVSGVSETFLYAILKKLQKVSDGGGVWSTQKSVIIYLNVPLTENCCEIQPKVYEIIVHFGLKSRFVFRINKNNLYFVAILEGFFFNRDKQIWP